MSRCGYCEYPGGDCSGGCPNYEPPVAGRCDECGADLYDGEEVVEILADGYLICSECWQNATQAQLLKWIDAKQFYIEATQEED